MIAFSKDFAARSRKVAGNLTHRGFINKSLGGYETKRDESIAKFQSWGAARQAAAEVKWEAVNHLDKYLEEFTAKFEARGGKVFWASRGEQACEYIVNLAHERGVKRIVKSKAMTSEEVHLNKALREGGYEVVESDLGEYIVELTGQGPYHFVFPAMHLTRGEISAIFEKELGTAPTNDPEELTMIARRVLREVYVTADMGISGANFAVAETGMISITENEGNARLTTGLPKIHVAIMGIEKMLPKFSDLALFLPMLATAGTGQALTGLQLDDRRPAPARRGGRTGGVPPHPAGQPPHAAPRRPGTARRAALHPVRRMPERLPGVPVGRRTQLRHDVPGSHRQRHHPTPARVARIQAPLQRVVSLRGLHERMPGEDRPAPPPAAQPPQRRQGQTRLVGKAGL